MTSGYVTLILGALVGLVCTPFLLRGLGAVRFGTYSLLAATVAYFGLCELGLGTATIIRVAAVDDDGPRSVADVVSSAYAVLAIASVVILVATGLLTLLLHSVFSIPTGLRGDAEVAFLLMGLSQGLGTVALAFAACLIGTGRMHLVNLLGAGIDGAATVAMAACALIDPRLALIGAIQVARTALTLLLYRRAVRRLLGNARLRARDAQTAIVRRLFALGWRTSIASVMGTLAFGSDLILVGLLLSPRAAAGYAVALRCYGFMQRFATTAAGSIGPSHAYAAARSDRAAGFELLSTSILSTLLLASLCAIPCAIFAPGLLHLWLGRVPGGAAAILVVFCAVLIVQAPSNAASIMLVTREHAGEVARITTLSAAINVAASIALTASIGIVGPALGTLVAVSTVDLVYLPLRACKVLDCSYRMLVSRSVVPLIGPTALLAGVLVLGHVVTSGGVVILGPIAGASIIYIAALWRHPVARGVRDRVRVSFST